MAEDETDDEEFDPFLEIAGEPDVVEDDDRKHLAEQLRAKSWKDLGVLERGGKLLFPEKIWRRDLEGNFVGDPCLLAIPAGPDLRKARREARALAKTEGIDPKEDKTLFDDLETACLLWWAVRSPDIPKDAPPEFFPEPLKMDALELERCYGRPSLMQLQGKLAHLRRVIDPKVSGLKADELEALTAALVAQSNLSPLFVCDDATQTRLIVTLASLHQAYVKARSSAGSRAPSRADSSPPESSEKS